jgi:hypothetical protein
MSSRADTVTFRDKERVLSKVLYPKTLYPKTKWYKFIEMKSYIWKFPGCFEFIWQDSKTHDPIQVRVLGPFVRKSSYETQRSMLIFCLFFGLDYSVVLETKCWLSYAQAMRI